MAFLEIGGFPFASIVVSTKRHGPVWKANQGDRLVIVVRKRLVRAHDVARAITQGGIPSDSCLAYDLDGVADTGTFWCRVTDGMQRVDDSHGTFDGLFAQRCRHQGRGLRN